MARPPQAAVEAGLIGAIASPEQLLEIWQAGIRQQDFVVWGDLFAWISNYQQQYQILPTHDQIRASYTDWQPPEGDFRYWLQQLQHYVKIRQIQQIWRDNLELLEEDPDKAGAAMLDRLETIHISTNGHMAATDIGADLRYTRYLKRTEMRKKGYQLWGIPTGLKPIDGSHQGWMPGELIGIYARPSVGKTWFINKLGAIAWMQTKNRILLISPEMPESQMALRIDVLIAAELGIPLSHKAIVAGDSSMIEVYAAYRDKVKVSERWFTVDSIKGEAVSVGDIRMLHKEYKPTLILIDGLSLLKDEDKGQQTWEKIRSLSYRLKQLATAIRVPIIVTHQAVNSRRGRRTDTDVALGRGEDFLMPSLNDAAFGDSFVQAANTIITMAPDRNYRKLLWYSLRKTRDRDTEWAPRWALAWDVDSGHIFDMSHHGQNEQLILQEMAQLGIEIN